MDAKEIAINIGAFISSIIGGVVTGVTTPLAKFGGRLAKDGGQAAGHVIEGTSRGIFNGAGGLLHDLSSALPNLVRNSAKAGLGIIEDIVETGKNLLLGKNRGINEKQLVRAGKKSEQDDMPVISAADSENLQLALARPANHAAEQLARKIAAEGPRKLGS